MIRPLDGLTVVSLEHAIAAPLCTRQLADLGARVIKIERPGVGDFARGYDRRARGLSSHFVWTNRGKLSLTLDLKHEAAPDVLQRLLAQADVLVQNLAPGASARLGLDAATLRPLHPRLIVCDISGYGQDGPHRDRKAYDLLIQAEAGFLAVTGSADEPAKAGIAIADIAAGSWAHSQILAALIQRGRTGQGVHLDISMLEALAEWMGYPLYYTMDAAEPPPRAGAAHATIYPYGPFACGDGQVLLLGLQNEREWHSFCTSVLQQPGLVQDPRFASNPLRQQHRTALRALIDAVLQGLTAAQLQARLDEAQIANARLNSLADLWAHPQLAARQRWAEVGSPAGPLPALKPPGLSSGWQPEMGDVPALGQHTDALLTELGLDADRIAALHATGAV